MKSVFFCILIQISFLSWAYAETDYSTYLFLDKPERLWLPDASGNRPDIEAICKQMKYNYHEELERLRVNKIKLSDGLKASLNMTPTPEQLQLLTFYKSEISSAVSHLNFLAKPEWNVEVVNYTLRWALPPRYGVGDHKIKGYEALSVRYLNQQNGRPLAYFRSKSEFFFRYELHRYMKEFYFEYAKTSTYLEVCQFIPSLKFEIELTTEYSFDPQTRIKMKERVLLEADSK